MAVKKKSNAFTWKSLFQGCYKIDEENLKPAEPKKRIAKQTSFQRISLSDISNPGSAMSMDDLSMSLVGSNLHLFTLLELRTITQSFSQSNFIGEGGFGPVHKGFIDDKMRPGLEAQPVAVKLLDLDGCQGHKEWLTEVIFLGQLRHPHLVKLIGYCYEEDQRLLVYEYMPRGSLENHLFRKYGACLPWSARMKIAAGAAKGLAFLHEADKPVIYRDFKASNILLDSDYTAKLSDFGLAKDGPEGDNTHVSTRVMGTHGYAAPEYIMTGHLTSMSDVYSFGVVLLELITGRRSMDKARPNREQNLVEWARHKLNDPRKLELIIDPRLEGQYSVLGAQKAAALAYICLSHHPKTRPTMSNVVKTMEPIQELNDSPTESFVYIVSADFDKVDGGNQQKEEPKKESKYQSHRDNGYKQRLRSPGSPTVHSEYTNKSGLRSPRLPTVHSEYTNKLRSPRSYPDFSNKNGMNTMRSSRHQGVKSS